jgi:hypothetical protein
MIERLTDQQLQILWEQWQPAAIEIQTLRARVAKLEAALKAIAEQPLEEELHPDFHGGDYHRGYEIFIRDARAALKDAPQ